MNSKIIKLYYKKLDKPTNLNGLILHPFLQEDRIIWKYENPNDVSFYTDVINGYLEELLYDFLRSVGINSSNIDWKYLSSKYCKLENSDVYISYDTRNKINQQCDRLNTIKLNDDGNTLTSDCYVRDWSIEYPDTDSLYVHVSLELTNPQIIGEDGEPKNIDYDTLSEFLTEFMYNDTSSEQESDSIWNVTKTIISNENMFDDSYMYSVGVIKYCDSFGNNLLN